MKKDVIVLAAMTVMLVLVICSCGNGGKYPTDGLFGELPNKLDQGIDSEKTSEGIAKLMEGVGIPVEADADVPLDLQPMHIYWDGGNYGNNVTLRGSATLKRNGVFQANRVWSEPQNDDEAYDFEQHVTMLMYDKNGKAIYAPDFNLIADNNFKKSGLKRIVNAAGTELAYSCSFSGTYPTALDAISHVAKIKLIDLSAHRDEYNELRREQDKVEKEFRQSRGQQY